MPVVDPPLAGVRVLELAQEIAGPFCGKLLAEFGAQVIKVEPPSGDMTRHRAPFGHGQPDPEGGLEYLYLNTAKRSITLHLGCQTGMRLFGVLLPYADVVISDQPAPAPAITPEHNLIYACIRPFGLSCTIPELLDDPQYEASGFFQDIDHPSTGSVRYPGIAFQMPSSPGALARAPRLGEHNAQVYAGWLGISPYEQARLRSQRVL